MNEGLKVALDDCLSFCKDCANITDVYLAALYESAILLESIRGEAYFGAWQRMTEACDTVIVLGYHQQRRAENMQLPLFLFELHVRLTDQVFAHDKTIATFLGRPPRLSYRYCVLELPLDLDEHEVCLEGAELEAAVARLDSNGYNTNNRLSRATWRRVWAQHSRIREEILELYLGISDDGIASKAQRIRERIEMTNACMPDFVRVDIFDMLANMQSTTHPVVSKWEKDKIPLNAMHLICIHCGIRHTEFMLERALINRTKANASNLIPKARALLKLVLAAFAKRDYLRDFQVDLVCNVGHPLSLLLSKTLTH